VFSVSAVAPTDKPFQEAEHAEAVELESVEQSTEVSEEAVMDTESR
jgi:hypothetical protein